MTEPIMSHVGDDYLVAWPNAINCEFQHVRDQGEGIYAELTITVEGYLAYWGRITLPSARSRAEAVKMCTSTKPGHPWHKMIDEACRLVVADFREGAPVEPLEPVAPDPQQWLVDGLIPVGETTVLFGDGGSGKSLLALALAVCGLAGSPLANWRIRPITRVLYLDWESTKRDHDARLWALTAVNGRVPAGSLLYRPMTKPASEDAAEVRTLVARHQVDLLICDSLGPACGAEPETAGAATGALNALRSCAPATRLVIAHVSKTDADRQHGTARPFGSVYVQNLARSVIEARRNDDPDEREFTLTLTHTKANLGPRRGQTALRWLFDEEGYISITKGEPDMARASLAARILGELRGGALTAQALGDALKSPANEIRARLGSLEKAHRVVRLTAHLGGAKNKNLWGLADTTAHREPC
jgi:hypothetical protein